MGLEVFVTIMDGKGQESTVTCPIPIGTAAANWLPAVRAITSAVDKLTAGRVTRAGISMAADFSGWLLDAVAGATSDVQEKARFVFRTAANHLKSLSIPAIEETIISTGTAEVDRDDVNVAAFVNGMEDGFDVSAIGGTGTVAPVDSREEDLTELVAATETWGKARG